GSTDVLTGKVVVLSDSTPETSDTSKDINVSCYPNPFNPTTNILFSLPADSAVEMKVFNIKGQLVKTLVDETMAAGEHKVVWEGKNDRGKPAASGIYFIKIHTPQANRFLRTLLLK
nr:FlgD immunoglobulin-like domain containing protein [Candidatus Cloacimonadota bacterium]